MNCIRGDVILNLTIIMLLYETAVGTGISKCVLIYHTFAVTINHCQNLINLLSNYMIPMRKKESDEYNV